MERKRYSYIAHAGIRFWNPLDERDLVQVLRELPIHAEADVLDYGCGEGEVLVELVEHHSARVTGVDVNEDAIARCRVKLAGSFFAEAFRADRFAPASFDLIVNLGASPGLQPLLAQIAPLLRRDGRVLIGDGYWQRPPSAEYLTFLGATETDTPTHEDNMQTLCAAGFAVERAVTSTPEAWDRYEDRYHSNMLAHLRANPDDPEFAAFEARCRTWRDMYLRHGRGTMGFALYQARISAG